MEGSPGGHPRDALAQKVGAFAMTQQRPQAFVSHPGTLLRNEGIDNAFIIIVRLPDVVFESRLGQVAQVILDLFARMRSLRLQPFFAALPANGNEVGFFASFNPGIHLNGAGQDVDLGVLAHLTYPDYIIVASYGYGVPEHPQCAVRIEVRMNECITVICCSRSNPLEEEGSELAEAHQRQNGQQPVLVPESCDAQLASIGTADGADPCPGPCKVLERTRFAVGGQGRPGPVQPLEISLVLDHSRSQSCAGQPASPRRLCRRPVRLILYQSIEGPSHEHTVITDHHRLSLPTQIVSKLYLT